MVFWILAIVVVVWWMGLGKDAFQFVVIVFVGALAILIKSVGLVVDSQLAGPLITAVVIIVLAYLAVWLMSRAIRAKDVQPVQLPIAEDDQVNQGDAAAAGHVTEPAKLLDEQPTGEADLAAQDDGHQVTQGDKDAGDLPQGDAATAGRVTEHGKPLDEQPKGEPDQSDQGDSGPHIPQHGKWTRQEWDAIFDWFYGVPRKECQSEKELAVRIGREESYVRKQKQLYDNSHDLKGNTQNV
jgi:hypothetical protein